MIISYHIISRHITLNHEKNGLKNWVNLLLWLLLDVLAAATRYPVVGIIAGKPANFMHFSDGFPMKKTP